MSSWTRTADGQNGVTYTAGSGAPASSAPATSAGGATIVGGETVDSLAVTGAASVGGATTLNGSLAVNGPVNLGGFSRVTSADFTTTGQALVDITGLTFATVANAVYMFSASLSTASGDVNGIEVGVQHSGAGASIEAIATGSTTAAAGTTARISALNTASPAFNTVNGNGGVYIEGILTVGATPGNLTIQLLKVTSGTATVRINSFLDVKRIA